MRQGISDGFQKRSHKIHECARNDCHRWCFLWKTIS